MLYFRGDAGNFRGLREITRKMAQLKLPNIYDRRVAREVANNQFGMQLRTQLNE